MVTTITETPLHTLSVSEDNWNLTLGTGSTLNEITSSTTSDGTAALYLDSIRFESTNGGPTQLGEMAWESTDGSIDAQLENGVIAAFAEDGLIRVRNTSGVPIAKGDALRYTGTNGATGRLNVAKWVGANVTNAREFMGFAACAMADNSNGYAQWFGKLEDINTTGGGEEWIDGQIIYAIAGTSATISDTAPTAAGEYVVAAAVINAGAGTSGSLFVRPSFAKNIASADITDASYGGSSTDAGKVPLFNTGGKLVATSIEAEQDSGDLLGPKATYYHNRIVVYDGLLQTTLFLPTSSFFFNTLMLGSNNLSDLTSASTARTNLGLGTTDSVTFWSITQGAGSVFNSGAVNVYLLAPNVWRGALELGESNNPRFANLTVSGTVKTTATVFASLPSAITAGAGARSFITDCNTTTFLATAAGGGASAVPVVSNGTNWLVG